ncbi:Ras guanyl-nucleotide exchange factor [Niveomyces insectorum RCEF 264]|uniref:Ras guanyl-nucleotide exchange factor n=1 Tax=Niveomyces insectorum RCEF 264 TaxID=1081102 RepID=A0A162MSV2_9HYPO|nr:Ras guanyl-nucleotide exchange factor [Niveomyces insectorum RCEF 264]
MAPSSSLTRFRTHTLSEDRASQLQLPGDFPRRKSASSLPAAGGRGRTPSVSAAASASASAASAAFSRPPLPSFPVTAPTTPSVLSATATSFGPWGGTFLDADADGDADVDADTDEPAGPSPDTETPALRKPPAEPAQSLLKPQLPPTFLPQLPPSSSNPRDSFISILDDPFFQRYDTFSSDWFKEDGALPSPSTPSLPPDVASVAPAATAVTAVGASRHDASLPAARPPPRKDSLSTIDHHRTAPTENMETVNIAVIGTSGVGKSAFIQRALRLSRPQNTNMTAIRLDVEGMPYVVALIELDLECFDVDPKQCFYWPKQVNGQMVPRIDGALVLYDVMNKDSIRDLPPTVSALHNSGFLTVLVATKCDNPESIRQVNTDSLAAAFPYILASFKTSASVPSTTGDCLQAMVLAAVHNRKGADKSFDAISSTTRRRAASSAAHLDSFPDSINGRSRSSEQGSGKHNRASSDLSLVRGGPAGSADRDGYYRTHNNARSPRIEYPNTPQLTPSLTPSSFNTDMTDDSASQSVQGMLRTPGVRLDAGQGSFLDIEESDAESYRYSDDIPPQQRSDELLSDKPAKMVGTTFDELVDRLLTAPMTRADTNFSDVFLCLYRKFAAPHELLSAIIRRLDATWGDPTTHFLERTATQFRIIEVVARWVSLYPGDFARPASRKQLEGLVNRLADEPVFTLSSQQIRDHLEHDVVEDDDTGWACCDSASTEDDSFFGSAIAAVGTGASAASASGSDRELRPSDSMRSFTLDDPRLSDRLSNETGGTGIGGGPASATAALAAATAATAAGATRAPAQFQFHSYEDYEREAATMVPTATLPLNKARYHTFMALDSNDVAEEITRIDWIMFSSIRIRDLVRHVSLSAQEKERCRSLSNTNRMIAHFNHVAKWVSNMILIRDKAKHRAPCLQKFMMIALRLRQLKNYNGLAAVLAGINGTSIHRLTQTWALVSPDVQKRFARLVLLMSSQKSHSTYRLAWENSPLPRIPYMPLHRRDLVSAEEGSRTFVGTKGDRINWKKFEVLGEVLLPIMKSQEAPYPNLRRHQMSRETILDCRMPTDDEEIYQRSVQAEPTSGAFEPKKKFPWLPK